MNILVAATVYTVLMYVIIEPRWRESIFILAAPISEELVKQFERIGVQCFYSHANESLEEKLKYDLFAESLKCKNPTVYGNDHIYEARSFIYETEFVVIDDGFLYFSDSKMLWQRELSSFKKQGKQYITLGWDSSIKQIYTTQSNVSGHYKDKIKVFDLKKIWKSKDEKEQDGVLLIFKEDRQKLSKAIGNKKTILITQCLSENGMMPEKAKVQMYKEILGKYTVEEIAIKPHPAEKTNYEEIFPEYVILNKTIPFQIIELIEKQIERIATVHSTAFVDIIVDQYEYMLEKHYRKAQQNLLNFVANRKSIVCYGCGGYGQAIMKFLACRGIKVEAFIVSDDQKLTVNQLKDIPIYKLSSFPSSKDVAVIICIMDFSEQLIQTLKTKDFCNVYELEWNPLVGEKAYGVKS